jgi:hypothetical protein
MQDLIWQLLLVTAAVLLVWLSIRARRIGNRLLKWSGIVTAGALAGVAWGFLALAANRN